MSETKSVRADQLQHGDVLDSSDGLEYKIDSPHELPGGWVRFHVDVSSNWDQTSRFEMTKPADEMMRVRV